MDKFLSNVRSDANCSEIYICASGNVFINYRKLSSFAKVAAISSFLNLGLCPVSAFLPAWTGNCHKSDKKSKNNLHDMVHWTFGQFAQMWDQCLPSRGWMASSVRILNHLAAGVDELEVGYNGLLQQIRSLISKWKNKKLLMTTWILHICVLEHVSPEQLFENQPFEEVLDLPSATDWASVGAGQETQ